MKYTIIIVLISLFSNSAFSQGWMPVEINDTYYDFHFPTSDIGYGVSPGFYIIKTINGGLNWDLIANEGYDVQAIYFVNAETGFVSGDYGKIFKTTNGGYNWIEWMSPYSGQYINDITFTGLNTGYACSYNIIYKTTDQGVTWDTIESGISGYKISFVNNNTGFMTGGGTHKTTNGGESWIYLTSISSYYGIEFINEMTGYVGNGRIYKTTNGGYHWDTVFSDTNFTVRNIFTVGVDTLYAGSDQGVILKSVNSGVNWSYQDLNIQGSDKKIAGLYFINGTTGFCGGGFNDPFFYYTTTGGTVGISNISSETPEKYMLHQNYPNPFNPETKVKFEIPRMLNQAQYNRNVRLVVSNSLGQEVSVLVNEILEPGIYEHSFDASSIPSGVYFYTLMGEGFAVTKRMVLLK